MIICPCCEGDVVWLVELDGYRFKMCFECDSVWPLDVEVKVDTAQNFEKHIKEKGGRPDWSKVAKIEMLD